VKRQGTRTSGKGCALPPIEATAARALPTIWELPDELWERIEPILAKRYPPAGTGRPRADLRRVLDGIIYRLRSGVQWNQLPREFGADSTVHGWFQRFAADGVLEEIWACLVAECDALGAVGWEWQAADGVLGKSRFEGDARGPNPTDRAKMGTKKSVLVEQGGGPLGVVIAGANRNDCKLLDATIAAIVVERPGPAQLIQNLCLDKGYDNPSGATACNAGGYLPHIRRIGEEKRDTWGEKTHPARRWVVERTIAWLQKCRALLIRYDKKSTNYLGLIQLACALLWYRRHRQLQQDPRLYG
jgi:putative transposase